MNVKDIIKNYNGNVGEEITSSYTNKYSYSKVLPQHIGIDEFKGNCNHTKYLFHVFDLDTHETIDIVNGKSYDVLENYFSKIENKSNVKIVSMDMCKLFKRIVKDKFPKASIVANCFHFTRSVMNCLDELRLNIWRKAKGKERKYLKYLKTSLMKKYQKLMIKILKSFYMLFRIFQY